MPKLFHVNIFIPRWLVYFGLFLTWVVVSEVCRVHLGQGKEDAESWRPRGAFDADLTPLALSQLCVLSGDGSNTCGGCRGEVD